MVTDLGNLQLGIVPELAAFDAMTARLAALEAQPHIITVNVESPALRAGFGGAFQQEMAANAAATTQAEQAVASFGRTAAQTSTGIDTASVAMKGLEGNTKGVTTALLGISGTAVGVLAVGAAIGIAAHSAEQFQQSMANLQAVLHASPDNLGNLGAGIQESARTTVFTITNIADADRQLAKAGADANTILREQADVLNLASASNTTAADAAAGMVTAQKSFGLTAKDSTMIADDLSRAVDSSVGTFADMTDALKQVGPVAQQAGLSLQETTVAIAALQNSGLSGDTGTALRLFLQRLEDPSKQAQVAIHDLGLEVYDADGKMRSLADIADQLRLKTAGLSDEAKNADLSAIFGARGVRVADIFANQGSDGLQAVTQHEQELGSAADIAQTKLNTLSGQMKELRSSADTVAANFGGVLVPALSAAGSEFTDLFNSVAKLSGGLADLGAAGTYGRQIADAIRGATYPAPGEQPFTADEQRTNLLREQQNLMEQIAQLQPGVDAAKGDILGHLLGDDGGKAKLDQAKEGLAQINAELAKLDPAAMAAQGLQKLSQQEADLANQFSHGKISMDAALTSAQAWADTAVRMGADTAKTTGNLQDFAVALKNIQNAQYEARYADEQAIADEQQRAMKLLDEGAPNDLVTSAIFGKRNQLDPAMLVAVQAQLKQWEDDFNATAATNAANAKTFAAGQANYQKQLDADVANAQKQHIADIQSAATAAQSEVGKINLGTGGIESLATAAKALDEVRAKLAALGQDSPHLDALSALAGTFKQITDAEEAATAATRAFNLTLSETNKSIAAVGSLKSEYLSLLDAAEKRQAAGTASQSDLDIIAARSTALKTLDDQTTKLQQNGANLDVLGQLRNLPDYAQLDAYMRSVMASAGGSAAAMGTVENEVAKASDELKAIAANPWKATITATVQYQLPNGTPLGVPPGEDPATYGQYGPPLPPGYSDGGYARPQSVQSVGGGPYGNGMLDQGGGGGASGGIQWGDYQKVLSQYPGSPIANQGSLDTLNRVAAQMGVDPRTLMAIMQTESGYGANAGLIGKQFNYGGMGVNNRGYGFDSGVHATDGGPEYAGYADFKSFLMDISAWVKQNGSAFSNYQTADQGQAKNATMAQLQAALPLSGGAQSTDDVVSGVRQQIVALALQSVGQDKLVNYCEQFVEETVQAITGQRGATGRNERNATAAFTDAQAAGLETHTPKAGDLVYYPDAAGGVGHVAIYMGNGQQISTYDGRGTGDQNAVHVESVAGGARYIRVPGLDGSDPSAAASGRAAQGYGPGTYTSTGGTAAPIPGSINAAAAGPQLPLVTAQQLHIALQAVNAEFAKMDAPSIKGVKDSLTAILPVLTEIAGKALFGPNGPLTDTEKQEAAAAAWEKGLNYERDFAVVVQGITAGTISLDQATQTLASDIGGPLAQAYGQMGAAQAQIAAADSRIASLQAEQKTADAAHQDALKVIQGGQEAIAAAHQTATDRIAAETTAENLKYQGIQRGEQDRQRALQFSQQLEATDLQNQLVDLQTRQQRSVFNRTAQEQNVAASVLNANTNQAAAPLAASLAAMHERDLAQKDADTQAVDALQTRIRLESRQAAVDSYNLQTETINDQRAHENRMNGIAAETSAENLRYQRGQADIKAATDAENGKYQTEKDANAAAILAQNTIKTAAQGTLDTAQQAMKVWQDTGQVIIGVGQQLAAAATGGSVSTGFLAAQSKSDFPSGGWIPHLATGGSFMGSAIVGDTAAGGVTPYSELVIAPHGATVVPLHGVKPQGGGDVVNLNLGDVALMLSEADKADIRGYVAAKIDAVRTAGRTQQRAVGIG